MSKEIFNLDYRTNTRGEKLVWGSSTKLKREEIRNWILENCVDRFGNIDLSYLDFSDFKGDIKIEGWLIGNNFYCRNNSVNNDGFFEYNVIRGNLYDTSNTIGKDYLYGKNDIRGKKEEHSYLIHGDDNTFAQEEFLQGGFLKDISKLEDEEQMRINENVWENLTNKTISKE